MVDSTGENSDDVAALARRAIEQAKAAPPQPELNKASLDALGKLLAKRFEDYARDRKVAEQQWMKNLRQFLGIYDDSVKIDINRSRAYPKITRVKCMSMLSRLMNLLFPASEQNWTIQPSPVPNLRPEDLQLVLDELQSNPEAGPLTDETITHAVLDFARMRAKNLETEIADQLTELGGSAQLSYVATARRVLLSGIMYGMGVLKGPFARKRVQTRWKLNAPDENNPQAPQKIVPEQVETLVPQYDFSPIWDHYPDMSAKYLHQMDGAFERKVMSRQQLRDLAEDPSFFGDVIKKWLEDNQTGNYKEREFESLLRNMSLTDPANTAPRTATKYETVCWDGMLTAKELQGCGVDISSKKEYETFGAIVWLLGNKVIKCALNPWVSLEEPDHINTYHYFMFEEDDSSLVGNGLPQIMRDSALGVATATRMMLDNAGVICGPSVEVRKHLMESTQDVQELHAFQVFTRAEDEDASTLSQPAITPVKYDNHIPDLEGIARFFQGLADQETFVNPATGGDMQKGPSEPFRTVAGASLLTGLAALPFKDVVRNFDVFTESFMKSLIAFNKHFNTKESIKGDFQPVARGATSLIAKEVRGMAIDELARSITPEEKLYVNWKGMLAQRLSSRDIPLLDVMVDDAEAARREKGQAESQAKDKATMNQLLEAEIRESVANAVKNLSQADKNAALANATTYDAIGKGLVDGITPQVVADTRAGAPVPKDVVQRKEQSSGGSTGSPAKGGNKK